MTFAEMPKGRNNLGSKSPKAEMRNSEVRKDMGAKCPKVEMTFYEMSKVRNKKMIEKCKGRKDMKTPNRCTTGVYFRSSIFHFICK